MASALLFERALEDQILGKRCGVLWVALCLKVLNLHYNEFGLKEAWSPRVAQLTVYTTVIRVFCDPQHFASSGLHELHSVWVTLELNN